MNFVQLAIPFFILALFIEFAYGFLVKRQTYRLGDTINSLQLGVLSRLVGILRLGFSALVISWLVGKMGVVSWSPDHWMHWVLFIVHDFILEAPLWPSMAHYVGFSRCSSPEPRLQSKYRARQTSTDCGFCVLPAFVFWVLPLRSLSARGLNLVYQFGSTQNMFGR